MGLKYLSVLSYRCPDRISISSRKSLQQCDLPLSQRDIEKWDAHSLEGYRGWQRVNQVKREIVGGGGKLGCCILVRFITPWRPHSRLQSAFQSDFLRASPFSLCFIKPSEPRTELGHNQSDESLLPHSPLSMDLNFWNKQEGPDRQHKGCNFFLLRLLFGVLPGDSLSRN